MARWRPICGHDGLDSRKWWTIKNSLDMILIWRWAGERLGV
jgi:hypothetical protein